jgi:hypothetical protein
LSRVMQRGHARIIERIGISSSLKAAWVLPSTD